MNLIRQTDRNRIRQTGTQLQETWILSDETGIQSGEIWTISVETGTGSVET